MKTKSLVLMFSLAAACRTIPERDDGPGPSRQGDDTSIYDIQTVDGEGTPVLEDGAAVTLRGVVVVAVDRLGSIRDVVYVMEPEGGAFSGVAVRADFQSADLIMPGDLVDITGAKKDEFSLDSDKGGTITQLVAGDAGLQITKVGTGEIPEPTLIDPQTMADPKTAEQWEGVLVKVENVRLVQDIRCVGSRCNDKTLNATRVTGPFEVQSGLTPFPEGVERGSCLGSITGIGDYFFNHKIQPRTAADYVMTESSACLPEEEGADTCNDGKDNDLDGFGDCGDFSCENEAHCATDTTIAKIKTGETGAPDGNFLRLTNVLVVAHDSRNAWIQTQGAEGGAGSGIQIRAASSGFPEGFGAGKLITIRGKVSHFTREKNEGESLLQLSTLRYDEIGADSFDATVFEPTDEEALSEAWEGAWVSLEDLTITEIVDANRGQILLKKGDFEIVHDGLLHKIPEPTIGDKVSVVGALSWNPFLNEEKGARTIVSESVELQAPPEDPPADPLPAPVPFDSDLDGPPNR